MLKLLLTAVHALYVATVIGNAVMDKLSLLSLVFGVGSVLVALALNAKGGLWVYKAGVVYSGILGLVGSVFILAFVWFALFGGFIEVTFVVMGLIALVVAIFSFRVLKSQQALPVVVNEA